MASLREVRIISNNAVNLRCDIAVTRVAKERFDASRWGLPASLTLALARLRSELHTQPLATLVDHLASRELRSHNIVATSASTAASAVTVTAANAANAAAATETVPLVASPLHLLCRVASAGLFVEAGLCAWMLLDGPGPLYSTSASVQLLQAALQSARERVCETMPVAEFGADVAGESGVGKVGAVLVPSEVCTRPLSAIGLDTELSFLGWNRAVDFIDIAGVVLSYVADPL